MPYQNIAVRQAKSFTLTGQNSPISLSLDSAVAAGSALVLVGTAIASTEQAALLGTPTGGGTWSAGTNTRASGDYAPNVCASLVPNLSAGSPSISVPFTVGGSAATNFRFSGVLLEVEKVPTTAVIDKNVQGSSSGGATSTSTASSGTLAQTDELLLLVCGGWFGVPTNPAGYTAHLTQQNGSFIGCLVASQKVTATTAVTGTVAHEASSATSAILLTLKAAAAATYKYVFEFPATGIDSLPASEASIEGLVWRDTEPFSAGQTPEYYSGLTADSGTKPGDSTTRLLQITSGLPGGVALGQTLRGAFRKSGGTTKGSVAVITGTVASV